MTTTNAPPQLHAVTREVDPTTDPFDEFDPGGFAWLHHRTRIVTSGVAARLAPADTAAVLAAVAVDDAVGLPGTGAIAVGALLLIVCSLLLLFVLIPFVIVASVTGWFFVWAPMVLATATVCIAVSYNVGRPSWCSSHVCSTIVRSTAS